MASPMFTIHGRDVHHFVKPSLEQAIDDIRALQLSANSLSVTIEGVNVTVHAHHGDDSDTIKFFDVHLHNDYTAVSIRYGTTVARERERIMRHAKVRAVEAAWVVERELVQSGKRSINAWTQLQRDELLSKGSVGGMRAVYLRDVVGFPELAGDPKNMRFVTNER